MRILWVPLERMTRVGDLVLSARAGIGELSLDQTCDVQPGTWTVYMSTTQQTDDLVDELVDQKGRELHDGEYPWMQLLLVHEGVSVPNDLAELTPRHEMSIEAARFALLDEPAWELVQGDGFYKHLDGVEGLLLGGRGVQVFTGGDGRAIVSANASRSVLLVDLR
jgi:hypothetical protein